MTDGLYSTSELAELTKLDRTTVRKYLAGVPYRLGEKNAKGYTLADALPALVAGRSAELDKARLKTAQADAELRELRLQREQGVVVEVKEVRDYAQRLVQGIHQRTAVRMPAEIAAQLYKAESAAQITEILQHELGRVFNELRDDHKRFL